VQKQNAEYQRPDAVLLLDYIHIFIMLYGVVKKKHSGIYKFSKLQ